MAEQEARHDFAPFGGGAEFPFLMWQVTELQQHIKVLQAVGLNAMEGDEGLLGGNSNQAPDPAGLSQHSLETLLLAKNRHLEHELTMSRLKVADLTGQQNILCLACNRVGRLLAV